MGCDKANLKPGDVIFSPENDQTFRVIRAATEQEAIELAARLGAPPPDIEPGESFYEVETSFLPVNRNN